MVLPAALERLPPAVGADGDQLGPSDWTKLLRVEDAAAGRRGCEPPNSCAIVTIGSPTKARGRSRAGVAVRRIWRSLRVRVQAVWQRRSFRASGYGSVEILRWDNGHSVQSPGTAPNERRSLAEALPQRAVVAAYRANERPHTLFEEVVAQAAQVCGHDVEVRRTWAKSGVLVVIAREQVLRVALGGASGRLHRQKGALRELWAASPPPSLAETVPKLLASGRTGPAEWSLEERLPGRAPSLPLSPDLRSACVAQLMSLNALNAGSATEPALPVWAETVERHCDFETGRNVRGLATRAADILAGTPTGFGHGDFTPGNILVEGGRLVGVIDWEAAGNDHLAGLDLLHLYVREGRAAGSHRWGAALLGCLRAWLETGPPRDVATYADRFGIELDARTLVALFVAYWLQRLDYQLGTFADARTHDYWLGSNVHDVMQGLDPLVSERLL